MYTGGIGAIRDLYGEVYGIYTRRYMGGIREVYGRYTGDIREVYGEATGGIQGSYGKYRESYREEIGEKRREGTGEKRREETGEKRREETGEKRREERRGIRIQTFPHKKGRIP